jgi:protein SCO1/2
MFRLVILVLTISTLSACYTTPEKVRVIGEKIVVKKSAKGDVYYDTLSATPPPFCFINHRGQAICSADMKGKIWICDFFFTHCPSICVKMERNLLKVNNTFKAGEGPNIVSISIDPARDSVKTLMAYATKLGVENTRWDFLTGEKDSIYRVAENFLANAAEDSNSPGGFIHDGNFILIDRKGRIRGFYNGVDEVSVDKMISDIKKLYNE